MAESNSLLNCRTGNRTAGSNPALSAIFFAFKFDKKEYRYNLSKVIWNKFHHFAFLISLFAIKNADILFLSNALRYSPLRSCVTQAQILLF